MRPLAFASLAVTLLACAPAAPRPAAVAPSASAAPAVDPLDASLAEVDRVHGGHGPWAVAGYRMGRFAMTSLGLPRHSFDLEVIHHAPRQVQYSCIADGAAASTGASPGKLNLSLVEEREAARTVTVFRQRSTNRTIALRPTAAFAARFLDVPRERLAAAGREAMALRDEEIFESVDPAAIPAGAR